MDKKPKKKETKAVKRKTDDNSPDLDSKKPKSIAHRIRFEEPKDGQKIEVIASHPIEYTVAPNQQLIPTGQMVEGYDQPVFVSVKGEPVQLGPNTVIVYEQSGAPANFTFSGNIVMDTSGRLVMAEPIYDVKNEQHDQSRINATNTDVEIPPTSHHDLSATTTGSGTGAGSQHGSGGVGYNNPVYQYSKVTIVEDSETNNDNVQIVEEDGTNGIESISDEDVIKWMNPKLTDVMRKLQMNYDAGVKLMLSPTGGIQCIYFTTPSMQLAFNTVPQFLCIQTGIEFSTVMVGNAGIRHNVCLFLAEDGNGKSVIVSGGISTFGENLQWLLETFKSCNPAWRQVRCIVAEPNKHRQDVRASFPNAHVTSNVYQICREVTRQCLALYQDEGPVDAPEDAEHRLHVYQKVKEYVLAKINSDLDANINTLKYSLMWRHCPSKLEDVLMSPDGPLTKLESWLEGENNYTNVLHKGLEKIIAKFTMVSASNNVQPEGFINWFFQVANQVEGERRSFAIARLQETMSVMSNAATGAGSIPADTITQYACSLMSHQTTLAQRALDSANIKGNRCSPHSSISKYGTSTQECSCLFSKVFRLPCRHILMLTTELKVKTHIPFEPRWTIQHCLFGCGVESTNPPNASSGTCYEQLVVNSSVDNSQQQQHHHIQQATMVTVATQQQHQQPQYVLASQPAGTPQVIFCTTGSGITASSGASAAAASSPAPPSVGGGAVLTPLPAHERA